MVRQARREVQGVRLVEAVAVQQDRAVEAVGYGDVRRRFVLEDRADGIEIAQSVQ
mgnify:CR=1 FL=1